MPRTAGPAASRRAEKLLESAAIKLSPVVSDLHGVTGRDIMDHLIAGVRDPKAPARLARARARRKTAGLEEALEGAEFFAAGHAALLTVMLARIDRVAGEIARLTEVIEALLAPCEEQLQQAESMPGRGRRAAQHAAGTGVDMTRFRTGGHLSSRAGKTPPDNQSGKRTGRANPGMRHQDPGADYYERQRDIRRQISRHAGKPGAPGFEVTLGRRPEPDPDQTGTTQAA